MSDVNDFTDIHILKWVEKYKNFSNYQLSNSIKLEHLIVYEWRIRKEIEDFDLKYKLKN